MSDVSTEAPQQTRRTRQRPHTRHVRPPRHHGHRGRGNVNHQPTTDDDGSRRQSQPAAGQGGQRDQRGSHQRCVSTRAVNLFLFPLRLDTTGFVTRSPPRVAMPLTSPDLGRHHSSASHGDDQPIQESTVISTGQRPTRSCRARPLPPHAWPSTLSPSRSTCWTTRQGMRTALRMSHLAAAAAAAARRCRYRHSHLRIT